ncbi:hypothetical protein RF11_12093 [Thelohanellus kitauei]|uniref:Uncharacterized protein n=1 Tax=Thelohanellus kitauei TaxID=669202 RepID=A0A0C2JPQ7_THEKT|nr:hypothetical protein RF11_12093 [Thelohanellus kitauei]
MGDLVSINQKDIWSEGSDSKFKRRRVDGKTLHERCDSNLAVVLSNSCSPELIRTHKIEGSVIQLTLDLVMIDVSREETLADCGIRGKSTVRTEVGLNVETGLNVVPSPQVQT